mgnify:CR=1 FL=1
MELSTAAWMVHDTRLMLCVLLAIASIIVLISATKLPPFLSILIGTFIAGVGAGLPPEEVAKAFSKGAGTILGEAGIIIALGAMLGALMAESGAIFGGEHSAHYYFRDFWGADSGMLAALHVLAALGTQDGPLSELAADYQRYAASGEINFTVSDAQACVDAVLKSFADQTVSIDRLDGVTVDLGDGVWFNLRTSNTEPLLRLNAEAPGEDRVAQIVAQVRRVLSEAAP